MKTYFLDIIPKLRRYSEQLDDIAILLSQHWTLVDDSTDIRVVYIFRENGQLLVSRNGRINKSSWEYLGNNSIMIEDENETLLFKLGFFDKFILALKVDGEDLYALLVNENVISDYGHKLDSVQRYLNQNYIGNNVSNNSSDVNSRAHDNWIGIKTDMGIIEANLKFHDQLPQIGTKINMNGKPAPDGSYRLGYLQYIHVRNGVVFRESMLG